MPTIGSIVHGAYGDYYEQLVCLKHYKRRHPDDRLILFFASPHRWRELSVLDLSFADEVHLADALPDVAVDRFLQYQIADPELQADVLAQLPERVLAQFDRSRSRKPWRDLRSIDLHDPENQLGLGDHGRARLAEVLAASEVDETLFDERFTVGFLWRHRNAHSAISPYRQTSEEVVRRTKSELFVELIRRHDAHLIVAGMNVVRTPENWFRIEAKFTPTRLDVPEERCTYLKGLSWALELEIMRRCTLCVVMPSGFSEALWMKRDRGTTVLVDAPPHYLAKLLWNRMPLFDVMAPSEVWFQLRQPHSAERVLRHLERRGLLPAAVPIHGLQSVGL